MSKNLVIVESPTKVKTISKFLGSDYKVEACGGHIRDLPKSKMGVDIKDGFKPHYIIIAKKRKIAANLKKEARNKKAIYLASDPDREGEAIAWHITKLLNVASKFHRVVFNELTKDAVSKSFENPTTINMSKVHAQQARRILDRILGYELSPLLWKKVTRGLSAGRVQSVALNFIVKREKEIEAFRPEEYWELEARLRKRDYHKQPAEFLAKLDKVKGKKPKIKNKDEGDKIISSLKKEAFTIDDVKSRKQKRYAKPPFITSTLQQSAFNRFRFTASRTMRIAQQLYEGINVGPEGNAGLITYMRTDSVIVSEVALKQSRKFISEKFGKEYIPEKIKRYKSRKAAQEAHEAIRPTSVERTPEKIRQFLSEDQYKLYKLIWERFLASCMTEAELLKTTILIKAGDCLFKATASKILFDGFMIVFSDEDENEQKDELPPLSKNEEVDLLELIPSQHFTKAPPRYTDASLIKILDEKGIGRPSTYAPTIWLIISRHYIRREARCLIPTDLGTLVNDLLVKNFPDVLDEKFTARMEEELDKVEQGKIKWQSVLDKFYQPFIRDLEIAKVKMRDVKKEVILTDKICEICGRPMVIKWSRNGKFLGCSGFPKCKNAKPLDTGIKCPVEGCDGMLVMRYSKGGRTFYGCSNFPKCKYATNKLPETDGQNASQESRQVGTHEANRGEKLEGRK